MLGDIQGVWPEQAFEDRRNPSYEQNSVSGQQDRMLGEPLEGSTLCEKENKHGQGEHDIEQLVVLNQVPHLRQLRTGSSEIY